MVSAGAATLQPDAGSAYIEEVPDQRASASFFDITMTHLCSGTNNERESGQPRLAVSAKCRATYLPKSTISTVLECVSIL